jgi:hypothetical protein
LLRETATHYFFKEVKGNPKDTWKISKKTLSVKILHEDDNNVDDSTPKNLKGFKRGDYSYNSTTAISIVEIK